MVTMRLGFTMKIELVELIMFSRFLRKKIYLKDIRNNGLDDYFGCGLQRCVYL